MHLLPMASSPDSLISGGPIVVIGGGCHTNGGVGVWGAHTWETNAGKRTPRPVGPSHTP